MKTPETPSFVPIVSTLLAILSLSATIVLFSMPMTLVCMGLAVFALRLSRKGVSSKYPGIAKVGVVVALITLVLCSLMILYALLFLALGGMPG